QAIRARGDDFTTLAVLIPALGLVDNPTPQSEELLRELSGRGDVNIRTTAQLALGVMARNLSDTAPERTARIVRDALRQLEGATQADERRQMLLVLGNIGDAGTLDAIRKHARDVAPEVRSAAAAALRWLEVDGADELLAGLLAADADAVVRGEAAAAL